MKTETEIKKEIKDLSQLMEAEEERKEKTTKPLLKKALRDSVMSLQAQIDILNWVIKTK